jgi:lysophospholipase
VGEAAPLVSIPQARLPPGRAEWFSGAGGARLRAAVFPAPRPRGSVVLSGGRTEFIEKYAEVIGELVDRGFTVLTHDWRGQGLSQRLLADPMRGHAEGFDDFIKDYSNLLDLFEAEAPAPRIALSHSMGGCLTIMALAKGERRLQGAILSAPMLGLTAQRSWPVRALVNQMVRSGAAARYALGGPYDPFVVTFEADRLTHDRSRYERTRALIQANRALALGAVTWGWVHSAFSALAWLRAAPAVADIALPLTILGAGQEKLVDNAGQQQVAARIPACRYRVIPEAFHEILMETNAVREIFWAEFDDLAARVAPPV